MRESISLATSGNGRDTNPADSQQPTQSRHTGDTTVSKEPALLLRRLEVAHIIGVGGRTLDRMLACNKFPPADLILNSKLIRWRRSTVEQWVEAGGK